MAEKFKGPLDRLELYDALVATLAGVARKGATSAYTSRNGWMFSFLDGDGEMSLRLSATDRDEFFSIHESRTTMQHGREMKEFVVVPDVLLDDVDALAPWFEKSHGWIGTLKPKPTKRKK